MKMFWTDFFVVVCDWNESLEQIQSLFDIHAFQKLEHKLYGYQNEQNKILKD